MKKTIIFAAGGLCLVAVCSATPPRAEADPPATWNRQAAAAYLDQRATWWTTWPNAQRDHRTFCISCHTALPYALAPPALPQAPGGYAASPENQERVKALDDYLRKKNEQQPLLSRAMLLWASTTAPTLLSRDQQQAIVDALLAAQQTDGGWSTATLGSWKRADGTPLDTRTDGYATGLVTLRLASIAGARMHAQ